jgi:glutaminase
MRTDFGNDQDAAEAIRELPDDPRELSKPLASSNLAALYVMASNLAHLGGLPANSSIDGTYQGFVQVNNLRLTPQMMAMAAATLANGGINPVSGQRVLSYRLVRHVLTTMMTAGLYDGSGRWAYTVGMPAKSGVAGGLVVGAPGVGGFATVSEPLDLQGNSARGQAFFGGLSHKFPFLHSFTPGAGSDANLALTPVQECRLASKTVEQEPGEYSPE